MKYVVWFVVVGLFTVALGCLGLAFAAGVVAWWDNDATKLVAGLPLITFGALAAWVGGALRDWAIRD